MKGKDPECLLYDCPHKRELSTANDEIEVLNRRNNELYHRLTSMETMLKEEFKNPDQNKTKEILSENIAFRKTLTARESTIASMGHEITILKKINEDLEVERKFREERDIKVIRELRHIDKNLEDQQRKLQENEFKIGQQDAQLKALDEFRDKARLEVQELRDEHIKLISDNQRLVKENKTYTKSLGKNKSALSKYCKRVLSMCKRIQGLKTARKSMFNRNPEQTCLKVFRKLKSEYFALPAFEKSVCAEEYDKTARLMGE
jgi:chromosome segregation ATPase